MSATSAANSAAEFSIAADTGELRRASAWLDEASRARGVPEDKIGLLDICLNEALANSISYGGAAVLTAPIDLHLDVRCVDGTNEAMVTVSDAGMAFDPFSRPAKPRPRSLAEAEPGGLGVLMICSFADTFGYCHGNGRNHLSFGVRWPDSRY